MATLTPTLSTAETTLTGAAVDTINFQASYPAYEVENISGTAALTVAIGALGGVTDPTAGMAEAVRVGPGEVVSIECGIPNPTFKVIGASNVYKITGSTSSDLRRSKGGLVTLQTGDLSIGAVELKDHTTEARANVVAGTSIVEAGVAVATKDFGVGFTTDAVVATDAAGTLSAKLRGLVKLASDAGTPTTTADQTVGAASASILAANANRKSAIIQNTGTANARVCIDGVTATASKGLKLVPGQFITLTAPHVPRSAITAIRESGSDTTVAVVEVV